MDGCARLFDLALPAGAPLLDALAAAFATAGHAGGMVDLAGLELGPFAYVMPALSPDGANAAFYSEVFRPAGLTFIESGALTFGRRDGRPFFHAHALWREADGSRRGGHILPDATCLARAIALPTVGLSGVEFLADFDPETNFKLFGPIAAGEARPGGQRALAVRLRPNVDPHEAIERLCLAHGFRFARLFGGVGSTIGACFGDGREINNFATEIFLRAGRVAPDGEANPVASLDIGLVDFTGALAEGVLARGQNRVLMTLELLIVEG